MRVACLMAAMMAAMGVSASIPSFERAKSVWPQGRDKEMNTRFVFSADFAAKTGEKCELKLVAWYSYRVKLNGEFVAFGPARGPKGFFRADVLPLKVKDGNNSVSVEVAGYNVPNYYEIDQPPFVKAELLVNGKVKAATGVDGEFSAVENLSSLKRLPRYSFQRTFSEAYRLPYTVSPKLKLAAAPEPKLIDRVVPYPDYEFDPGMKLISLADVRHDPKRKVHVDRSASLTENNEGGFKGYRQKELELVTYAYLQQLVYENRSKVEGGRLKVEQRNDNHQLILPSGKSALFDHGLCDAGFVGCKVKVIKPGRLALEFDEMLVNGEARGIMRYRDCVNGFIWDFDKPGEYDISCFEPYVMRYVSFSAVEGGEFEIQPPTFRSYKNATAKRASFKSSDKGLERIFDAASETFRQNAVDVFTDCPSRERAGWNCDAYFTSPVSTLLTGNTDLERVFEEIFALPEKFDCLPEGMLPMCYPSDHVNGNFIPNWAMWFTLETEEYLKRSGDRKTIEMLRPRLLALVKYFNQFKNSDGLLEKLPGWNFIEWSRANALVWDVNYPANMTYASVLEALDRMYDKPELSKEAARMRDTIRKQSWNGKWFCDNAVRQKDGSLKLSGEVTETCQYYAFFFNTATPETYPELWKTLVKDFGPKRLSADRTQVKSHKEIWPSNMIVGNYLRLKLFERLNMGEKILEESKGYFLYMADRTGTLWEHNTTSASCDHGFASHAAILLVHGVLGAEIDLVNKCVFLRETDAKTDWIEATFPVGNESVVVRRVMRNGKVEIDAKVPAGWRVIRPPSHRVQNLKCELKNFRSVGPGGGGWIQSMLWSRFDKDRFFVGCDVGGFYYSEDAGRHYEMRNRGLKNMFIETIAEHPTNPDIIFLGSQGGIYKTTDRGLNWQEKRNGLPPISGGSHTVQICRFAFDPANPDTIYAAVGQPRTHKGARGEVWRSDDCGESWRMIVREGLAKEVDIYDFSLNPKNAKDMLVSSNKGMFRSVDGGETWKPSNAGLPGHLRVLKMARCDDSPNVVYVTLKQKGGEAPWSAGVYRSDDGGATWTERSGGLRRKSGVPGSGDNLCDWTETLAVDRHNPDKVFTGGATWWYPGAFLSEDGGKNWKDVFPRDKPGWIDFWGPTATCMAMSPLDGNRVAFGTSGMIYITENSAKSWTQRYSEDRADGKISSTGLEVTCLHSVVPSIHHPGRFYLGYYDVGLLVTEDYGKTMVRPMKGVPRDYSNSCFALAEAPDDPDTIWALFGNWGGGGNGCVMKANAKGKSVSELEWEMVEKFNGFPRDIIILGTKPNWTVMYTPKASAGDLKFRSIAKSGESIYGVVPGTDREPAAVYVQRQRGGDWQKLTTPKQDIGDVQRITACGDWVLVTARGEWRHKVRIGRPGGAWLSTDAGKTWRMVYEDYFCGASLIRPPSNRESATSIYVSLHDHPFHDHSTGGGVIHSTDAGQTWKRIDGEGLQNWNVTTIAVDPKDGKTLWLGTSGNSIFVER